MARMQAFQIDPRSIQAFIDYANDFKDTAAKFRFGMDKIMMMYAYVSLGEAQRRSLGPVDPTMQNIAAAWQIPVRRITGMYFAGWRVEHMGIGVWALTNDSREAFYIEFGINHPATTGRIDSAGNKVRIRRPVMKLSVLEAINIIKASATDLKEFAVFSMPANLYQSPYITGSIREQPRNVPDPNIGALVNISGLQGLAAGQ